MKSLNIDDQEKVIEMRRSGLSHRQISNLLNISLGSVFKYSKGIKLTRQQHLDLMLNNYQRVLAKMSRDDLRRAAIKGGKNTSSHFRIKYQRKHIISLFHNFNRANGRIPTKRDFVGIYRPVLRLFKTWNAAIGAAGFSPNPVLFAKKYTANDGHRCDSLAEKIIDDWLSARKIKHEKNVRYPNTRYTADFKIDDAFVEFFGLYGQVRSYEEQVKKKLAFISANNYKLISIFPEDIFPQSRLHVIFQNLIRKK